MSKSCEDFSDDEAGWERKGGLVFDDVNDQIEDLGDEDSTVRMQ